MYFKFDYIGDRVLVNVPDHVCWEIRYRMFDDDGNEDHGIYLTVGEKEYQIRDLDYWCMGREKLPYTQVALLYEAMVDAVSDRLTCDPDCKLIDMDSIESDLLNAVYEKLWIEKGYIIPNENGHW